MGMESVCALGCSSDRTLSLVVWVPLLGLLPSPSSPFGTHESDREAQRRGATSYFVYPAAIHTK